MTVGMLHARAMFLHAKRVFTCKENIQKMIPHNKRIVNPEIKHITK